jgi:hypothetical protein
MLAMPAADQRKREILSRVKAERVITTVMFGMEGDNAHFLAATPRSSRNRWRTSGC